MGALIPGPWGPSAKAVRFRKMVHQPSLSSVLALVMLSAFAWLSLLVVMSLIKAFL